MKQLIQTKDYLLLIDEEAEIKEEKLVVRVYEDDIMVSKSLPNSDNLKRLKDKRVFLLVAYYPLTSEAKELDLPLLPNPFDDAEIYNKSEEIANLLYNEERYYKYPEIKSLLKVASQEGYKAAQSKGQHTLEDIEKKADVFARERFQNSDKADFISNKNNLINFVKQFTQSISTQQLPKEFIPEYEDYDIIENALFSSKVRKDLKIITNSEGKQELVGTYKY